MSNEALNVIKDFMEVFSFDDMLHGVDKQARLTDEGVYKRVNVLTPLSSPFTSPIKSPIRKAHLNETYDVTKTPIMFEKTFTKPNNNSFGYKYAQSVCFEF